MRDWLGEYQQGITSGKYDDVKKQEELLQSISHYVDTRIEVAHGIEPSFTVGLDSLKIAFKGSPLNTLKNQFGVRSMVNDLIYDATGKTELKKLLAFFGHRNSVVGMQTIDHFCIPKSK